MRKNLIALMTVCALACAPGLAKKKTPIGALYNNAYCIRTRAVAFNGKKDIEYESYGTAFVVRSGLETILTTNKHVINIPTPPDNMPIKHITYSLVTNENDTNINDDKFLEVIAAGDSDVVLLKYKGFIPKQKTEYCNPVLGEPSYVVGFPFGEMKVLDEGIISNVGISKENGELFFISSAEALPGMSGGPNYTTNNTGGICLYGMTRGRTDPSGFSIIVPSFTLEELVNEYIASPKETDKRLKEQLPIVYEYQGLPVLPNAIDHLDLTQAEYQ